MIPKKIHYCWFGKNPLPEMARKCIDSWKKYCPDYEIIEWNEDNFDLQYNDYVKEAYAAKKWAFVTDVVRLYALVTEGGIYMDTDVEVLKPLDDFLTLKAFSGFESIDRIPTGIMAAEKEHPLFKELLLDYENAHFINDDGTYNHTTNVTRITNTCLKYGLLLNNTKQTVNEFALFPNDYFCPKNCETLETILTENTYTIHHFDGSWLSEEEKYYIELFAKYKKNHSTRVASKMARIKSIWKYRGLFALIKEMFLFFKKEKTNRGKNK